jgi:hypothetical protein
MKQRPAALDPQSVLEEILRRCGSLHPVARRSLAGEARRLWQSFGIVEPIRIDDAERRARAYETCPALMVKRQIASRWPNG